MRIRKILSIFTLALVLVSCNNNGIPKKQLKTEVDSVSYAVGLNMGLGLKENIKNSFSEADQDLILQGLVNALDSTDILIGKEDVQGILRSYFTKKQEETRKEQEEKARVEAEEKFADEKAAGEKLMAENISKEGVQTTESGLQYIVLKEGEGEKPTATDRVKVHYHGTLFDGTVFDSSVDRGTPSTFGVGQVIKGWTEGLQLMSVGSKYKFFIPQELAYGHRNTGKFIKPFSPLVFEVELLEIVK